VKTLLDSTTVLVVGAGVMGTGIAQVAAQAGHPVLLFDAQSGAADAAKTRLEATFEKLVGKGKYSLDEASSILSRIETITSLDAAAGAGLVIEAIVESMEVKRALLQQLESIVTSECILATNTSSISVTAIANGLQHPQRLVGMHFFNPVPLMKLVEVVSGLQTKNEVAEAIFELAEVWGKVPVHARSTPGFIVNRIARPYYAETLALLQEQAATPAALDACLRGAGFRMGPCELMDLIGHDTNMAVTRSVYRANFYDKRYVPSLIQQDLVDAGLLGRKTGQGFFDYSDNAQTQAQTPHFPVQDAPATSDNLVVHGEGAIADHIVAALRQHDRQFERSTDSNWIGLQVDNARLGLTDGRCAAELGGTAFGGTAFGGTALGRDVAVFDLPLCLESGTVLAWSHAACASVQWVDNAPRWLALLGVIPQPVKDLPGLVVARTIAMVINEAADAVQQGVCDTAAADTAMKLGVNYPAGPFEWLADWNLAAVIELLDRLDTHYRGERYRVSPWLRQQSWRVQADA
jgi:3-hydroxybutyryl-CoA dehydrogenase